MDNPRNLNSEGDALAPIAVFAFNRRDHLKKTLVALQNNVLAERSILHIFSDAPQSNKDERSVRDVRLLLERIDGFKEVTVHLAKTNQGLATSIINGVSYLCNRYEHAIVLEDDLETSPFFLNFMNDGLRQYKDHDQVGSISGYMYPVSLQTSYYFRRTPQSWGWATWKRAWKLFQPEGQTLLTALQERGLNRQFSKQLPNDLVTMLKSQVAGKNSSWYVRWAASLFLAGKLTLMPGKSLIRNIGFDGTGTHCNSWKFDPYRGELVDKVIQLSNEQPISIDATIEKALKNYFFRVKLAKYLNFFYRKASEVRTHFRR